MADTAAASTWAGVSEARLLLLPPPHAAATMARVAAAATTTYRIRPTSLCPPAPEVGPRDPAPQRGKSTRRGGMTERSSDLVAAAGTLVSMTVAAHRCRALESLPGPARRSPGAWASRRDRIDALRERVGGVRWVDAETTHFTLHFFAELPAERVPAVVAAVGAVVAGRKRLAVSLGGLGSFPAGARARVLWVGLGAEACPVLAELGAPGAVRGGRLRLRDRPASLPGARDPGPAPAALRPRRAWRGGRSPSRPGLPAFTASRVVLSRAFPATGTMCASASPSVARRAAAGR